MIFIAFQLPNVLRVDVRLNHINIQVRIGYEKSTYDQNGDTYFFRLHIGLMGTLMANESKFF